MPEPLRIFIGYDSREPVAYHVLAHSILRRSSVPVAIAPMALNLLNGIYSRQRGPTESTEFSLTRFLVPYLSGYQGISLFMDSDMLCLADVAELCEPFGYRRYAAEWAVKVCRHEYTPKTATKFLGQPQTAYPRKNWSSFMVFNNVRCQPLSPEYVNRASGLELHRFQWTADNLIASLPLEWNWLVGEYDPNPQAKILHYTLGGPWFEPTRSCDHADLWFQELKHMVAPQ